MNLNSALIELQNEYSAFCKGGRLISMTEMLELPIAARQLTQNRARKIQLLANNIERAIETIKMQNRTPVAELPKEALHFYSNVYKPTEDEISALASKQPELLLSLEELDLSIPQNELPEKDDVKLAVVRLLSDALSAIEDYESDDALFSSGLPIDTYDGELLNDARKYIESKFFQPRSLAEKSARLRLIAADREEMKFPGYVRVRAQEVAETYLSGQNLSAIASSRALLEFALANQASCIGFSAYHPEDSERLISLNSMVLETIKLRPDLRKKLEHIQKQGNEALHPPKNKKVRNLLPNENLALSCVNGVFDVLSEIYTK